MLGPWLDLTGLGLEVLAVALGAWVAVDNWLERVRRSQENQPAGAWTQVDEAEEPTGAEEILAAFAGPVVDRITDADAKLVARTRRATGDHRGIQLASIVCVRMLLTCLVLVLFLPLLLAVVVGYVCDSRSDSRLRLVVVLFAVGIAIQVMANL
jgi:hypothetical protein